MSKLDDLRKLGPPGIQRQRSTTKIIKAPPSRDSAWHKPVPSVAGVVFGEKGIVAVLESPSTKKGGGANKPISDRTGNSPNKTKPRRPKPGKAAGGAHGATGFVGVRLPMTLIEAIDDAAKKEGSDRSAVIRTILDERLRTP